ncbi:NAD(P)-dependent alcohol dehydrogenase [Demequina zhanjiangensis]|uniref:alcohol dehydrogenase (NADP(+)) n=1 Tax=Demequina zhanjiangensis TaxID=3051659 RepID=A0ABT8FZQ2_9MICO|nr:NAD(P)-dependent alcohol dehydrogenase [Demequina sp. SYSU T00b26]MDN4472337.1 NAD(P)-dependent alcohol dehydrogenase [Demequina sp. SYSU T00b26]
MSVVNAIVATSPTAPLERGTVTRRDPGPRDVAIEIAWAGVCHSDIHTARDEWGQMEYPLAVGHEITGVVTAVGSEVTRHSVGDRVGVGCMVGSCRECANCKAGHEQYCEKGFVATYGAVDEDGTITQGGYATDVVVAEDFVLAIPDALPLDKAAPLLCAGITTYSPLSHWKVGPGVRVAVVGMGGLGHLAVKLAHAMGAEVTVLSQSLRKKDDGLAFGADHFYATSDPETFTTLARSFDVILNTVSAPLAIDDYLGLLDLNGTFVSVGAPPEPAQVTLFTLFTNRRRFAGSSIGGIAETAEMLEFCAENDVVPEIEVISADQINEAWERVVRGDVRYRYVIDIDSLRD